MKNCRREVRAIKKRHKFWQFKAKEEKTGDLLLYGIIESQTWWGDEITPKQFKKDLDALGEIDSLNVYINSDGGDVFAAQAIYSMLKRHKAKVVVFIDGLAASAASVIAMAGDVIYMPQNAMMMIHNPWTIALGNAEDFRKLADDLDKIRNAIISVYETKTGLEKDKIIEFLDSETWFTAEEAVELGFADELEQEKKIAAQLKWGTLVINGIKMDLSKYSTQPELSNILVDDPPEREQQEEQQTQEEQAIDLLFLCQETVNVRKKKYLGGN